MKKSASQCSILQSTETIENALQSEVLELNFENLWRESDHVRCYQNWSQRPIDILDFPAL